MSNYCHREADDGKAAAATDLPSPSYQPLLTPHMSTLDQNAYYPNYQFNTQNPPINLWGQTGRGQHQQKIPSNVIIPATSYANHGARNGPAAMSNGYGIAPSAASAVQPLTAAVAATQRKRTPPPQHMNNQTQHPAIPATISQSLSASSATAQIQRSQNRATHRVNLSSITHNYHAVNLSAARQQCQVIVVVKADGYGHGAIATACHLASSCQATAFAVATLEEGIALRRAFEERVPYGSRLRILVLGAPIGYPQCFDLYLHHNIELMVCGPEVAASLKSWMVNHDDRRRAEVQVVAEEMKSELLVDGDGHIEHNHPMKYSVVRQKSTGREHTNEEIIREKGLVTNDSATNSETRNEHEAAKASGVKLNDTNTNELIRVSSRSCLQTKYNAATLTNVTGNDLAKEVRQILVGQQHAKSVAAIQATVPKPPISMNASRNTKDDGDAKVHGKKKLEKVPPSDAVSALPKKPETGGLFIGIDDAARASRQKELRANQAAKNNERAGVKATGKDVPHMMRKKIRWHALVDSGMGRLGFKTDIVDEEQKRRRQSFTRCFTPPSIDKEEMDSSKHSGLASDDSGIRDTVSIIKELYDSEVHEGAPIEFYGMCTHMADANSTSTYTQDQMDRFRSLVHRVRATGIAVPTVSTDNSAALLTTSLTHFDPHSILAHDTRGYVRCGGAIYGQRPAFKQLRAVSTFSATVKHVAIIKQGESVGYDRAYVAPYDVKIATLAVGFADGYPRELGNGVGKVSIRGNTFPVAGNVCMDMLMVDLGPATDPAMESSPGASVAVEDIATLWGPENDDIDSEGLVPLADLASTLKTTQSALTCGLSLLRVQRQYE